MYRHFESSAQPHNNNQWEQLRQEPSFEAKAEQKEKERQYCKLVPALLQSNSLKMAESNPRPLTERQKHTIFSKINNGEIAANDARNILINIKTPIHEKSGANGVTEKISQNKHEWKILSFMIGENPDRFDPQRSREFLDRYPTPFDFEQEKSKYLQGIKTANNEKKYQEYVEDMERFCHDVYGKRQEYYERFLELVDTAKVSSNDIQKQETDWNIAQNQRNTRHAQEIIQYGGAVQDIGFVSESKAKVTGEATGRPNQDAVYIGSDGFYAIFDGVGGSKDGAAASQICSDNMSNLTRMYDFDDPNGRESLVTALHGLVDKNDASTCTIAQIKEHAGGIRLNYISIGDSRLYLVRRGEAMQITRDDSITEEMLSGHNYSPQQKQRMLQHGISRQLGSHNQFKGASPGNSGSLMLQRGDRIVICSDGVTGDTEADVMDNKELAFLVSRAQGCQDAAKKLSESAAKSDDSSVIVVEV